MRAKYMKYILILLISILYLTPLSADTSVNGFFPENFVREGSFKDKPGFEPVSSTRQKFFITREERRLHPDQAPSNNIHIPRTYVRVRSQPVIFSNGAIANVWSTGVYSY